MKRQERIKEMTAILNKQYKDIPGIHFSEGDKYYMIWVDLTIPYEGDKVTPRQIDLIYHMRNIRYDKRLNGFPVTLIGKEAAYYLIQAAFFVMSTGVNFTLCLRSDESVSNSTEMVATPKSPLQEELK